MLTSRVFVLAVSGLLFLTMTEARVAPDSGKIRLLYIGDPWSFQQNRIVLDWIRAEPRFTMTVVPADLEVMIFSGSVRFTRLYLPRDYESLNSSYDVLVPNNISPRVIETRILEFFRQGVEQEGIGTYFVGFVSGVVQTTSTFGRF